MPTGCTGKTILGYLLDSGDPYILWSTEAAFSVPPMMDLYRVSGRSVRFCTLSGAFLTSVEVPIERRAVDTKLLRHLTC